MTAAQRTRFWRTATILPSVLSTVLGIGAVLVVTGADAVASPASFQDGNPVGIVRHAHQVPGGFRVSGYDFDYDARRTALTTYALIDGKWAARIVADDNRPNFAQQHPAAGPNHGYAWTVPVPEGAHTVCIGARNVGRGKNTRLGCYTRTFDYGPFGALDPVATVPRALHITGWAIDADSPKQALTVTVSVDGTSQAVTADKSRPALLTDHKAAGADHGFDVTIPVAQGTHRVCVTGLNIGYGTDNALGCRNVVLNDNPIGHVDSIDRAGTKIAVRGWAFDPDRPTRALTVAVRVDGKLYTTLTADRRRRDLAHQHPEAGPDHGFFAELGLTEGVHNICLVARNVDYGTSVELTCQKITLSYTPTAALTGLTATPTGAVVSGWAKDPDTTGPITVKVKVDGTQVTTVTTNAKADSPDSGHSFRASLPLRSGTHNVCVIGVNVGAGTANSQPSCKQITLALSPLGAYLKLSRASGSTDLVVRGWAVDPDTTTKPISVTVSVDGSPTTVVASQPRNDVASKYPWLGPDHGIVSRLPADDGEHTVCVTADNVGGGADVDLGCKTINAVNPVPPDAPGNVVAKAGDSSATVTWTTPASDGGAPESGYVVTATPGGASVKVGGTVTSATVTGLQANKAYTFAVTAVNVAGSSPAAVSNSVTPQSGPPVQRTPAPVSTSRYIRNIHGATATDLATMRAEGRADAKANPSGHRYLILLDIGGQDQYDGGVVLSATTRFVSYSDLVRDLKAYAAGYHSAQRTAAPIVIAIGTNNDMDVSRTSGMAWAQKVVNPVRRYAGQFADMTIAGANDIEPGFRAGYRATNRWLAGYLAGTKAPFVFNGSADGCSWTATNRGCNNGWTMAGLYHLAAGASPTRLTNLPQIYNTTMASQWKYISLTGITQGHPRIRFGGPLTEWTACDQSRSCGSLTGHNAWSVMWQDLQSDKRLKVRSLPYSTDLRIDK